MTKILIFTESQKDGVKNVTYEILGKLSSQSIDICAIGDLSSEAKSSLAKYGVDNIYTLKSEGLKNYSPEGYANALKEFITSQNYDYVFAGSTSLTKDFFPRLAGQLDVGMASEVIDFVMKEDQFCGTRPLFAGKCLAEVALQGPRPHIATIRPNALGMPTTDNPKEGKEHSINVNVGNIRASIKEVIKGASEKLDLTEANIIVSGGRSLKSAENFRILHELADVLGATVGASRAAVDSGLAPHSMQVGQTGKTVSPTLYIACGISGAIQHLAGMRTSKVIVAINTDPDAPIFTKADYGIVGDLFEIVPMLTEEFKKLLQR